MKKILPSLLLLIRCSCSFGQTYNNEWIDYSKTYYKFQIGSNGLYRISQPSINALGLANTPAQHFQLWRNGVEVPLYTSVSTGLLSSTDYLEFYGEANTGATDTKLYKADSIQMNPRWSLYTDSAAYFLTINSSSANARLNNAVNDVAGNSLAPEPYFLFNLTKYYRDQMNPGMGLDLGEIVHGASYETAEGWSNAPFGPGGIFYANNAGLHVYPSGPDASLLAVVAGNTTYNRTVNITINGTNAASAPINSFAIKRIQTDVPLSMMAGSAANMQFTHNGPTGDNIVVAGYELTYPRMFNFDASTQFAFELPASGAKYLEIDNFANGGSDPILYDLTNNLRLTGVVSGTLAKFVLPSSAQTRKLVLLSTAAPQVKTVGTISSRNFINYELPSNQGDYLIISHPLLFNDGAGNNYVDQYRAYRSSTAGGSFNAKVYDINQLIDQFGFGIKHHPSAIRNFGAFALARFAQTPQYVFLIGKGLSYYEFRRHESDPNVNKLALVPTFGYPSSDNLLLATREGTTCTIPIGRLSAITGTEIGKYLNKVKQFDVAKATSPNTLAGKAWMKNFVEVTGGLTDPGLSDLINIYMDTYTTIASDSLYGGKVYRFSKNSGLNTALGSTKTIESLINEGVSVINYFGHSSPNTIEFNLDKPENYNNTGKYPLIIINGCNAGDLFQWDTLRAISSGSLSEKFTFADQKGSIGYIANTHFGLPTELDFFNQQFYRNLCRNQYGESLGKILKSTMEFMVSNYSYDYIAIAHAEEITLHGDPAIQMYHHDKPDYVLEDTLVNYSPTTVSVADGNLYVYTKIINIGKAVSDSFNVKVTHMLPDSSVVTIATLRRKATLYEDTINVVMPINPITDFGFNEITVTADFGNAVDELSEANNTVTKRIYISNEAIRPVWPYQYAIVNTPNPDLYGSTANPLADMRSYVMEIDTSQLFNSPLKYTQTVTDSGGAIRFRPNITMIDSAVYYWRIAFAPASPATAWQQSSFTYINNGQDGFAQGHFHQFKENDFYGLALDSTRKFSYENRTRKLLVRTGLYPYYGYDQINVNIDNNQIEQYACQYAVLQFLVYDPLTLKPWVNAVQGSGGRFGSVSPNCDGVERKFFEFPYYDTLYRRKALEFFDSIPAGYYVSVTNLGLIYGSDYFVNQWKSDTIRLGSGKSLWHKFHQLGLHQIDSFSRNLPFAFIFKMGDTLGFTPKQQVGPLESSPISMTYDIPGKMVEGSMETPWFGPATNWDRFKWDEQLPFSNGIEKWFDIIGRDAGGNSVPLGSVYNAKDSSLSFVDAGDFPYIKMQMSNRDEATAHALQLKYWMVTGTKYPEGVVSPNISFQFQDTLNVNDTLRFRVTFKNISQINFDSLTLKLTIKDRNNVSHVIDNLQSGQKLRPLPGGDSVEIAYDVPMALYFGDNQVILEVNPNNAHPEQFHYNNYLFRKVFVTNTQICPGGNTVLLVGSSLPNSSFQWQVDTGTGYTALSDNAQYNGVTTDALTITGAPTSLTGYKFRCMMNKYGNISYGPEYTIKFVLNWKGIVSTSWFNAANWSCNSVPDANTEVVVEGGLGQYPIINAHGAVCKSIRLKSGSSTTVSNGFTLNIVGK